jgi:HAD superfamily hydrolase (TIGR01509 family)
MTGHTLEFRRRDPWSSESRDCLLEHGLDGARLYTLAEEAPPHVPPAGLLFACENVLYDATVWERWLVRLLKHVGVAVDQATFGPQWEGIYLGEVHCGRREFDEAFREYLRQLGLSRGLIDEVAAASQGRRHQFLRETRPLPQIRPSIAALARQGLALALLADSEMAAAELERHLTRLGFGGLFHFVLSSVELGCIKAEPEGYRAAAKLFRKPPEEIAFVGSRARHLRAAARQGMSTIAFNFDDQARADLYLRQFHELVPILKNWPLGT